MKINYNKLKSSRDNITLDKNLLKELEYIDVLFVISKNIIEYRERNNLTQAELANKLGITQVMISKIESGKYNFSVKYLVELWNDLEEENNFVGEKILLDLYQKVRRNHQLCSSKTNEIKEINFTYKDKYIDESISKTNRSIINFKNYNKLTTRVS